MVLPKSLALVKRLITILFLLLFLFNAGGYYALYWLCSERAEQALLSKIETENYSAQEQITLAIPLAMPYPMMNTDNDFDKMKGGFEFKGEHFKLVKQKLQNDTLYLVCLKNIEQQKIESTIADYSKTANDLPTQSKQTLNLLSKIFKEFQSTSTVIVPVNDNVIHSGIIVHHVVFDLLSRDYPVVSPPPESLS
jgi:hypothetical protein